MKKLSIIIPVYNTGANLYKLLESISRQINDQIEVIIVDDGSTDNTFSVAKYYESGDIKVYRQTNKGVGAARNLGLEKSNAEYIWFIDSDDEIMPCAISIILSALDRCSCDCYLFGVKKISGHRTQIIADSDSSIYLSKTEIAYNFEKIFSNNLLNPLWNKVLRADVIHSASLRFSDSRSGEDAEFVLNFMCNANSVQVVPAIIYCYKLMSSTSSSRTFQPTFVRDHKRMFIALDTYCLRTGASCPKIVARWSYETVMGFRHNIYNSLDKQDYVNFRLMIHVHELEIQEIVDDVDLSLSIPRRLLYRSNFFSYAYFRLQDIAESVSLIARN